MTQKLDSYNWDDDAQAVPAAATKDESTKGTEATYVKETGPQEKVSVGVSRLHEVVIPDLQ
jgi:hypothetical protein